MAKTLSSPEHSSSFDSNIETDEVIKESSWRKCFQRQDTPAWLHLDPDYNAATVDCSKATSTTPRVSLIGRLRMSLRKGNLRKTGNFAS